MQTTETRNAADKLLTQLVHALVDQQDEVRITNRLSGRTMTFSVKVAATDVGKLIGKNGRNAKSVRVIMAQLGDRLGLSILVAMEEPTSSRIAA